MRTAIVFLLLTICAYPKPRSHSNWKRLAVKNQLTDSKGFVVYTEAPIPGTHRSAWLNVICHPGNTVSVSIMAPYTVFEKPQDNELTVRFDKDPDGQLRWQREDDYSTLSSLRPRELLDDYLLDSSIFRVEVTEYPATEHVLTFHIAGLRAAFKGHCGI